MTFAYKKYVQFYETDLMGVVHHSNYLRYWEEARAAWFRDRDLMRLHTPHTDLSLAVLESGCKHHAPCKFGDNITIYLQVRADGLKMHFRYAAYLGEKEQLIATGHTLHIALDGDFRVCRLPELVKKQLEIEEWTETWP